MNNLVSRDPIQRFKNGKKIEKFQAGGIKRFQVASTKGGNVRYFDTDEQARAYQRTLPQGSSVRRDLGKEWKGSVLKVDRTNDSSTAYARQQAEAPYNKLAFKDAYALARKNGVRWFGYKGKVYKSDLEGNAAKNNLTEMEAIYGNNLGWSKDPKLGTKSSQQARAGYRKEIQAKQGNRRPTYQGKTNSQVSKEADAKVAKTWNSADFIDAVSPQTAVGNLLNLGASKLMDEKFTPRIYKAGYNVPGMAKDLVEGNYGDAAFRGLDAYLMFGAPGARWNLTPRGTNVTAGADILPNGTRVFSKWQLNALGPGATQPMEGVLRSSRGTTYFIDNGQFMKNLSLPALIAEPAVQQAYNIEK